MARDFGALWRAISRSCDSCFSAQWRGPFGRLFDLQLHGFRRDAGGLCCAAAIDLALHRVRERGDERGGLVQKFHALIVERQVIFALETVQPVFGLILAGIQQHLKALRAVFFKNSSGSFAPCMRRTRT